MEIKIAKDMKSPMEIAELWKHFRLETVELLKKVPADKFRERPENRWSIAELGEHLYLSQWTVARPLPIILVGKVGENVGSQPDLDYVKIKSYFSAPSGVKNPEAVQPLNNYTLEELLPLLKKSEDKLWEVLEGKTKEDLEKRGLKHPYFGLLNMFNFSWVMCLHEYSHIVALRERVAAL
jgi:hypothetical protein